MRYARSGDVIYRVEFPSPYARNYQAQKRVPRPVRELLKSVAEVNWCWKTRTATAVSYEAQAHI